jgi:DNA-binding NtrC family response regulator
MAELVFYRRGEELMRVLLDGPRFTLGRGPHNDLAVPDEDVSRNQAALERTDLDGSFTLVDLSGRGTTVDGTSHHRVALQPGAELTLGEWRAVFQSRTSAPAGKTNLHARLDGTSVQERLTAEPRPGTFTLRIRRKQGEESVTFDADEVSIGKDEENALVLDDRFVSSFHARIARTGRGFWLRDLGSTNGTFVNGAKVREGQLEPGSTLRVGETELVLELPVSKSQDDASFEGMVGRDPSMVQLFELIDRVAPSNVSVTVFGETGTGKELVARAIHARSQRHDRPFVPVNCSAFARELIESELFGHEKGSFTGADRARSGAFEEAHGGTIFLDEIGELPLDLQAKLLRTLENGEIKRVGSSRPVLVDVRVIAATNKDILARARRGEFREDLYYRLCVFPLTLPPLRRRINDLQVLTDYFIKKNAPGAAVTLTARARAKLAGHAFPGNIRELRNVVHRALLLRSGPTIDEAQVVFDAPYLENEADSIVAREELDDDFHLYLPGRTMEQVENEVIARSMRRNRGVKSAVAKELNIARSTVIKRTEGDGKSE